MPRGFVARINTAGARVILCTPTVIGEKTDGLEPFHPDRMASRILGMGDVLSLIEDAERKVDRDKAEQGRKVVVVGGGVNGLICAATLIREGLTVCVVERNRWVGGGAVMVPGLALGPGFAQQLAQGTSLAAMVPSGAVGAVVHARIGQVRRDVVFPLMAGIAAGSWIGGSSALALPDRTLRLFFSVVLILLGVRYLVRNGSPASDTS